MQVFLSYSSTDRKFARRLATELSNRGYTVWDPEARLFPGDNWHLKIGEALQKSKAMVVLLSPDATKSEWVRREVEYAIGDRNYQQRVFPVLIKPTAGTEFPCAMANFPPICLGDSTPEQLGHRIAAELMHQQPYAAESGARKRRRSTSFRAAQSEK